MTEASVYRGRQKSLRNLMSRRGLGRVLLDGPEVVSYFCGYTPPTAMYQGIVISAIGGPFAVARGNNRAAAAHSAVEKVFSYPDGDDPIEMLAYVLRHAGGTGPIGKDMTSMVMTAARQRRLEELLPGVEFIDISSDVSEMRNVKSPHETDLHRKAAGIVDEATTAGVTSFLSGRSLAEAALDAHVRALQLGADDRRTVVAKMESPDVEVPGPPIAMIELVPAVSGYDARAIRSVAQSEPSEGQLDIAARVTAIQDRQIEAMRPGALARDVDGICRGGLLEQGLRGAFDGLTGHGIGFAWAGNTTDTTLAFTPSAGWLLRSGMIFHMYTRARGFVIGDTVLVTDHGPEILTKMRRGLAYEPGGAL